jgi:soluble lytic murein transglycosylase-like protein
LRNFSHLLPVESVRAGAASGTDRARPSSTLRNGSTAFAAILEPARAASSRAASAVQPSLRSSSAAQPARISGEEVRLAFSSLHAVARPATLATIARQITPSRELPFSRPSPIANRDAESRVTSTASDRSNLVRARVSAEDSLSGNKGQLARNIRRASSVAGVAPELSVAVARAESSLNPTARSTDGLSFGTFQVTHSTAAEMKRKIAAGVVARPPGTDDIALGIGYLRYLDDLFAREGRLGGGLRTTPVPDSGERRLFAIAAYNAGEGRVAQAQAKVRATGGDPARYASVRRFLPATTREYVDRVSAYAADEMRVVA